MLKIMFIVSSLPLITINFVSFTKLNDNQIIHYSENANKLELFRSESFNSFNQDSLNIPEEIISESSVGEVIFSHLYHCEDEEIECVECHHEINAQNIEIPHENYFEDFWIDCKVCHLNKLEGSVVPYSCSKCHNTRPASITDEMISKKVAIHRNCWECHEVGTGLEASEGCEFCHIK